MTDLLKSKTVSGNTIRSPVKFGNWAGYENLSTYFNLKGDIFIQFFTDLRISYRLCNSVADLDLKNS